MGVGENNRIELWRLRFPMHSREQIVSVQALQVWYEAHLKEVAQAIGGSRPEEVPVEELLAGKAHPEIDEDPRITVF